MRVKVRWQRSGCAGTGPVATLKRELAALLGIAGVLRFRPYATLLFVFATAVFGVAVPWRRSLDFYDPILLFAYSVAVVLLSGPTATDLVGREWDSARTMLARIFACSLFSCALFGFLVVLGVATVNFEIRPAVMWPAGRLLGAAFAFNAAASLFMAAVGALIAVVLTPAASKLIVRGGMIVVLLTVLLLPRVLPLEAQAVLAVNLSSSALTSWGYIAAAVLAVVALGPIGALRGARR